MNFYDIFMAPLELTLLKKIRKKIIPQAKGRVLEIGFGTGANLSFYLFPEITELHALDIKPSKKVHPKIIYHESSAEELPFNNESFDTVVTTLALCSIDLQTKTIREIHRVLKPGGILIYLEHQQAASPTMRNILNKLNPYWRKMSSGCQINLETTSNIERNGFHLEDKKRGVFHYGIAQKLEYLLEK